LAINEKKIKEEIDDYEYTLQTLIALSGIFEHDFSGLSIQGKQLHTSTKNTISPSTDVTPDLVTEAIVSKNTSSGILTEIKVDLPMNKKYWLDDVEQLKKYDDKLTGWDSNIANHDIIFISNPLRTHDFFQYLNSEEIVLKHKFQRNVVVIHSSRMQQQEEFILIKKENGTFSHSNMDKLFTSGVAVPQLKIIPTVNKTKFYDSKPPLIYTMMIIWDHILKTNLTIEQLRDTERKRSLDVRENIQDILDKLSQYAPKTNKNCVRREWIIEAMTAFVDLKLASTVIGDHTSYDIKLVIHSGDTRNWLIAKFQELDEKKSQTLEKYF